MLRQKANHFFLVLFIIFSCFLVSAKPVKAASLTETIGNWFATVFSNESTTKNIEAGLSGTVSQETHVQSSTANLLSTLNLHMTGMASLSQDSSLSDAQRKALEKQIGYGVLGDVNKGIVALYTPPASTKTYVADVMKSARIVPEAQAQGLGFSALDPILETWKSFRNLAYLFFVVIFLVIGFMIMFRTKVGQAAITAQQAIPSVIVAMLAVTFSYAIAGFLIDLMYVMMYMLASFFTEGSDIVTRNIFGLVGLMFKGTWGSTQNSIEQFMEDALNIGYVGEALAYMSSLLGTVIVGVAILFATFRVFFELVKTYVSVIIQIVFSPIILMLGAIPGKNVVGGWLKNLVGNLILWPVVLLCILVQRMLTAPIRSLGSEDLVNSTFGGGFMPPFLVGQGQASIIPVILGIGILLVIPEIMQQVKKAIGVDEGVFGQLAGSAFKHIQSDFKTAGETAMPLLGGTIGAGVQGARAGAAFKKDNPDATFRDTFNKVLRGYEAQGEGGKITYGGIAGGLRQGFRTGQKINSGTSNVISGNWKSNNIAEDIANKLQSVKSKDEPKEAVPESPPETS